MKLSERIHRHAQQWTGGKERHIMDGFANEVAQLETEVETLETYAMGQDMAIESLKAENEQLREAYIKAYNTGKFDSALLEGKDA